MAGLAAAAQATQRGARVLLLEKGTAVGRLDAAVQRLHLAPPRVRRVQVRQCPTGTRALQRPVFERLDADLGWLESLGAPHVERETGNPLTAGAGSTRAS